MYVCIYIHVCVQMCVYMCIYIYIHIYVRVRVLCVCVRLCMYKSVQIHMYIKKVNKCRYIIAKTVIYLPQKYIKHFSLGAVILFAWKYEKQCYV